MTVCGCCALVEISISMLVVNRSRFSCVSAGRIGGRGVTNDANGEIVPKRNRFAAKSLLIRLVEPNDRGEHFGLHQVDV